MSMYDLAVIGGGPGGYVAAIRGAQHGKKVILFEGDKLGGTCLNRGCIPAKSLLKSAEYAMKIKHAKDRGIMLKDDSFTVDMPKVISVKQATCDKLSGGVGALLKSNGVTVVKAFAKVKSNRTIEANGEIYEAKNIIIASGGKASKPPIPGIESARALTSDEILSIDHVPESLIIIGGGVIGLEMATAFTGFGSKVTIVEIAPQILPNFDAEVANEMLKHLKGMGVEVKLSCSIQKLVEEKDGIVCELAGGEKFKGEYVLVSAGRIPASENVCELPLEKFKRFIKVNDKMETSEPGIYAIGDVTGKLMLAHAASYMGEICVENIYGANKKFNRKFVPGCVYTTPEIGTVGLTEAQCDKDKVKVARFPFGANGRALASGMPEGFVKVIADKVTGEIMGVHIVGGYATEMINEIAALMQTEITVNELAEIVHAHPSFSEAMMEAANGVLGKCVHLPK